MNRPIKIEGTAAMTKNLFNAQALRIGYEIKLTLASYF